MTLSETSSQGNDEASAVRAGYDLSRAKVLVVGAGIMGAGIAQVAAQAGHFVYLYDTKAGAAEAAHSNLKDTLNNLEKKGKLGNTSAHDIAFRIRPIDALADSGDAGLAVEAVVEKLEVKRSLFQNLENIVSEDCILATNTSSISVTAIGNGMKKPDRLVGMHFFNPVPVMKLVEVVSGVQTNPAVASAIYKLSHSWGKTPVFAKSTPGFIVNRIARPFYAEALALLQEQFSEPAVVDACMRAAGFRMGPCELMDLIGHDTNFAVTQSVFEANFFDKRYTPSVVQRELVDGGLLGKKSGQGFFNYKSSASTKTHPGVSVASESSPPPTLKRIVVNGTGKITTSWIQRLKDKGVPCSENPQADWTGLQIDELQIRVTDGRTATEMGSKSQSVIVVDLPLFTKPGQALAFAAATTSKPAAIVTAKAWLSVLDYQPVEVKDTPGLLVARTIAMLINEAADAVNQGVCSINDADAAMKLGVNYPAGPFEWLREYGVSSVVDVLENLDRIYRGERYRISPWLRLSLTNTTV